MDIGNKSLKKMNENTTHKDESETTANVGVDGVVTQHVPDEFHVGQRVKHRASGEIAIVVEVCESCVNHSAADHMRLAIQGFNVKSTNPKDKCQFMPNGDYVLDLGFEKEHVTVDGYLLEVSA